MNIAKIKKNRLMKMISEGHIESFDIVSKHLIKEFNRVESKIIKIIRDAKIQKDQVRHDLKIFDALELEKTLGNAIGKSIIIIISSYMKTALAIDKKKKNKFLKCGPKVKGMFWSKALNSSTNYIRHKDEWVQKIPQLEKNVRSNKIMRSKKNINQLDRKDSKKTARIISRLGFTHNDILTSGNDISYRIAIKLKLNSYQETSDNYKKWLECLLS